MKKYYLNLIFCSLILVGCENKFSSGIPTTETPQNNQNPQSSTVYTFNYSGAELISATTSTDPRAATCLNAGGVYFVDPHETDSYCLMVSASRWQTKVTELNQLCASDPDAVEADRRIMNITSTPMDTQLLELESIQLLCPNTNGFPGCDVGNALYFDKRSDTLDNYLMQGCT